MPLVMLGVVVGVVLFVLLTVTVAAWWVAAISGLGVVLVCSLVGAFSAWKSEGGAYA
jgi:hypothetical protein